MNPDRSHSDTVGRVANKVRVEEGFNPYFYVPKYRSSDTLPAPDTFFTPSKKIEFGAHGVNNDIQPTT